MPTSPPPRFLPGRAFPPYAFSGAPLPHPVNDPRGHSHGEEPAPPPPLDGDRWGENEEYLRGFDLFNHGYHWEAHEAWEGLWIAAGRSGPTAEFLKGLIKITAAGVKARQGIAQGVRRHCENAVKHFERAGEGLGTDRFAGFQLQDLKEYARHIAAGANRWPKREDEDGNAVFAFDRYLVPDLPGSQGEGAVGRTS